MLPKMTVQRIAFGLVAAAIAVGLGEGTARAQYAAPPLPPPVFAWSGGYVGLNAGVAGGADAISETGVTTTGSGTMTAFGGTGGLAAGYNWQGIGWLFGVEADVSYVGLHGSQDMSAANFSFITEHDSFQTSWLSTVRGRAGYHHSLRRGAPVRGRHQGRLVVRPGYGMDVRSGVDGEGRIPVRRPRI